MRFRRTWRDGPESERERSERSERLERLERLERSERSARHQLFEERRRVLMDVDALAAAAVAAGLAKGGVDRRVAAVVLGVEVGAVLHEKLDDIVPAPAGGFVQRREAARIFRVDVAASLQQQLQRFDRPLLRVLRQIEASRV